METTSSSEKYEDAKYLIMESLLFKRCVKNYEYN